MRMVQEFDALPEYAQKIVSEHIQDRLGKAAKKEKPAKKKKQKRPKEHDPDRPKHPTNAYLFFTVEERKKLQKSQPTASRLERVRMMSKRWKEMTDTDKEPFLNLASKDKQRYKEEIEAYKVKHGRPPGRSKRKSKKSTSSSPQAPKRPANAYLR